ncbi:MFS general substrate transporter [Auriscalpium vulgare]|uniref:MFS general substrate transporter n=1 Tax=Auriscalpium vulgare TaxID=40419 RepID=A0ACB8RPL1_9AGAM|nr:MFS general substrate transporter [Auriscalpium vulgare]
MSSGDIELTQLPRGSLESVVPQHDVPTPPTVKANVSNPGDERTREEAAVALAPVDGGIQAWTFVVCSFALDGLVWGFPFSYGVFQEWYISHPPFESASEASINAIGTVTIAIQYMEGIVLAFIAQRFPHWLRPMMIGGLVVCVASMLVSSFATKVWHLILLQGVLYGIAGGCLYMPVVFWLSEWFVTRRSFAGAIIFGGAGLGGAAFPIAANYLLQHVGFRWTIRAMALAVGTFGGLAILGVKPRLPIPPASRRTRAPPLDFSFIKSPVFISVGITVFLQALAYFPVSLYIPTYAVSLGYSRLHGTLALTVFNLATVIGQMVSGYYCDVGSYTRVMLSSAILSSILAYALWGFAHSLALVYVFVVIFGTISGGFSAICPPAAAEVHGSQPFSPFAFFGIAKGLAAVFGPFIAASLRPVRIDDMKLGPGKHGWAGYGFTSITIFVGSMMAATTVGSAVSAILRTRMKHSS